MYVCICNKVTDSDIRDAVNSGVRDLDSLSEELNVATCCGQCKTCAKRVLREAKAEQAYAMLTPAFPAVQAEPSLA
jgi:bacterioferritin-associated ferredoxin